MYMKYEYEVEVVAAFLCIECNGLIHTTDRLLSAVQQFSSFRVNSASFFLSICLMWSPMGPRVQWNLSNVVTCGTSCTVEPV